MLVVGCILVSFLSSPLAMLWGFVKLVADRPRPFIRSGGRMVSRSCCDGVPVLMVSRWRCDGVPVMLLVSLSCCGGVPVMLWWCPGRVVMVCHSCCDGAAVMLWFDGVPVRLWWCPGHAVGVPVMLWWCLGWTLLSAPLYNFCYWGLQLG